MYKTVFSLLIFKVERVRMYILVYTPPRSPMAPIVLYLPSIFLAFGVRVFLTVA